MGRLLITKATLELAVALNRVLKPEEPLSMLVETSTGNAVIGTRAFFVVVQPPDEKTLDAWPAELLNDVGDGLIWSGGTVIVPGNMIGEALKMMPKDKAFQAVAFGHAWATISEPGEMTVKALQAKAWIVDGKTVKTIMHPQPVTPVLDQWGNIIKNLHDRIAGQVWDSMVGMGMLDLVNCCHYGKHLEALALCVKAGHEHPDAKKWDDAVAIHNAGLNGGWIVRLPGMIVLNKAMTIIGNAGDVTLSDWERDVLQAARDTPTATRKLPPPKVATKRLPPRKTA